MYAEINQWVWVEIPPSELGPNFDLVLKRKVRSMYEGKLIEGNYYIAVDDKSVRLLDKPIVQDGTCQILCRVNFVSVIFRPFKDEVLYVKVQKVHKVGLLSDFGPMKIFISSAGMAGWKYLPSEEHNRDRYVSEKDGFEIKEQSTLCIRLQGIRAENSSSSTDGVAESKGGGGASSSDFKYQAIATINGPNLGPIRLRVFGSEGGKSKGAVDEQQKFDSNDDDLMDGDDDGDYGIDDDDIDDDDEDDEGINNMNNFNLMNANGHNQNYDNFDNDDVDNLGLSTGLSAGLSIGGAGNIDGAFTNTVNIKTQGGGATTQGGGVVLGATNIGQSTGLIGSTGLYQEQHGSTGGSGHTGGGGTGGDDDEFDDLFGA